MFFFSYETLIDPVLKSVRLAAPSFAAMQAGQTVLDVCCGTGSQVIIYAEKGLTATGIDLDEKMLSVGRKNRDNLRLKNASFLQADAAALPFEDGVFDWVSISFALHDKDDVTRDKIVKEMKRVVKPQGAFIFIDFTTPLPGNIWALAARTVEFAVGGAHYEGFKTYRQKGGMEGLLKRHSISIVKTSRHIGKIATLIKATCQP